ncbi:MAG: hypothetical protein HKN09_10450 [Saprospiraceae bacterium]|nr:hypothetical protein [Saprospiraceae bacterium]
MLIALVAGCSGEKAGTPVDTKKENKSQNNNAANTPKLFVIQNKEKSVMRSMTGVTSIVADNQGQLFAQKGKGALYTLKNKKWEAVNKKVNALYGTPTGLYYTRSTKKNNNVLFRYSGSEKAIPSKDIIDVASSRSQTYVLRAKEGKTTVLALNNDKLSSFGGGQIKDIEVVGNTLLAVKNNGSLFSANNGNWNSMKTNNVIAVDGYGSTTVALRKLKSGKTKAFLYNNNKWSALPGQDIIDIAVDASGIIYCLRKDKKVFYVENDKLKGIGINGVSNLNSTPRGKVLAY